jgi:predicted ATPase
VQNLALDFTTAITFFVGENGSGKSTLLEAIAMLSQLPIAGGGRSDTGSTFAPDDDDTLAYALRGVFRKTPKDGYFLRAEFLAHFAQLLDHRNADPTFLGDAYGHYGGKSLLNQSHGESFLSVLQNRVTSGLFLFDEPEAALSPQRQLTLLLLIDRILKVNSDAQFIIATHSPILLTFPGASIVSFDDPGLPLITFEDTSHYKITRQLLVNPEQYWRHLREDDSA